MLAGYLPFDDDPANPEGDNINLLYKYIVSTPLTFPEYVTPHARDLLRRILVPDPRRRADLFEVARHSWLSEYTHVVGFIGSKVKSEGGFVDANEEDSQLGRSASVREPSSRPIAERASSSLAPRHAGAAGMGGDDASDIRKQQRDAKRRTVQVEYVAPQGATARGEASPESVSRRPLPITAVAGPGKTRARTDAQGPVEVAPQRIDTTMQPPPSRSGRDQGRVVSSDQNGGYAASAANAIPRPNTSGTLGGTSRLPSRGNSYSQPAAAQPTNTTATGSFSQPKSSSGYIIAGAGPVASDPGEMDVDGRPQSARTPSGGRQQTPQRPYTDGKPSGHRRSSTLGSLADKVLNRSTSKRQSQPQPQQQDTGNGAHSSEKRNRKYPPVSMKNAMPYGGSDTTPRPSTDSRRPSFSIGRKPSKDGSVTGRRSSRRFSWLPGSLSMNNFAGKKAEGYDSGGDDGYQPVQSQQPGRGRPENHGIPFGHGATDSPQATQDSIPLYQDEDRDKYRERASGSNAPSSQFNKALPPSPAPFPPVTRKQYRDDGYGGNRLETEPPERFYTPDLGVSDAPSAEQYNISSNGEWQPASQSQLSQVSPESTRRRDESLRPAQRRFADGYEHGHGGSSSATRKVMDFFRRRGRERET